MKKSLSTLLLALTSLSASASYQYGLVSELALSPTHLRVQIQPENANVDERSPNCTEGNLTFFIKMTQPAATSIFKGLLDAKKDGRKIGIHGIGQCILNGEQEEIDTVLF